MSNSFTPGPWVVSDLYVDDEGFAELAIQATFQGQKCHPAAVCLQFPNMPEMQMANARLIAAAPELLAALQAVLHDCHDLDMVESNQPGRDAGPWLMATNAIAKATGAAT